MTICCSWEVPAADRVLLRRPWEMLKLDTLSMADAVSILMRSGPATLCIWSRDNILRQASEDLIRERLPDAVVLSEGDGQARFQTMLPGMERPEPGRNGRDFRSRQCRSRHRAHH